MSSGPALGRFLFDNVSKVWKSAPPPSHAAKHVRIELDRGSYSGTGVKKTTENGSENCGYVVFP